MLKRWTWLVLVLVALLGFTGCSDDDDPVTPPTGATAFETMAAAGAAYLNDSADCPGVISATALHDNLPDYTVIDIRAEADYLAGHIPGAYNTTLANLLNAVGTTIPTGKPMVIACYSGQSAGHAKIALELMGYEDVQTLKFGMSSWNPANAGSWNNNTANNLDTVETTNNNGSLTVHDFPMLDGPNSTVVARRVAAMLAAGFKSVRYNDIKDNLDEYFVLNYFGPADYLGTGTSGVPGHIPGAFQFTPYTSLGHEQMLKNLPTDKPIVVYCWTGQHSSQVTAYLNMLGYEAYSLSFGSNNLFHSSLTANKWTSAAIMNYDRTIGYEPTAAFRTMAEFGASYLNDSADAPGYIYAADLMPNLTEYTLIDIRAAADFNAAHIAGAYNVSMANMLTAVGTTIPTDKPFVVVCYTGQSASYAKVALEMNGYENSQFLYLGMCDWNVATSSRWADAVGDNLTNPETTNNNPGLTVHEFPALAGDPATIVATRSAAIMANGYKAKMYNDIKDNLDEYFVLNYFGPADYLGTGTNGVPGHIPGAFQFTPFQSLGINQMLRNLPTDKPIVVYCWTGQHSSQVAAYLNMLGYDAYSLLYGSNNLFYSSLTNRRWSLTTNDFPLVTP